MPPIEGLHDLADAQAFWTRAPRRRAAPRLPRLRSRRRRPPRSRRRPARCSRWRACACRAATAPRRGDDETSSGDASLRRGAAGRIGVPRWRRRASRDLSGLWSRPDGSRRSAAAPPGCRRRRSRVRSFSTRRASRKSRRAATPKSAILRVISRRRRRRRPRRTRQAGRRSTECELPTSPRAVVCPRRVAAVAARRVKAVGGGEEAVEDAERLVEELGQADGEPTCGRRRPARWPVRSAGSGGATRSASCW